MHVKKPVDTGSLHLKTLAPFRAGREAVRIFLC
jgi:hypothetical protein